MGHGRGRMGPTFARRRPAFPRQNFLRKGVSMRRTSVIVAAASLAIAGLSIPTSRWAAAADDRNPTNNSTNTNTNTGIGQSQSNQPGQAGQQQQGQQADQQSSGQPGARIPAFQPGYDRNRPQSAAGQSSLSAQDEQAVRDALARVVDDAATPGKFGDLLNQLSRADTDRLNRRTRATGVGAGASSIGSSRTSGGLGPTSSGTATRPGTT